MTYGESTADDHTGVQRFRQRRHAAVAHDRADVLDHGHQREHRCRLAVRLVLRGAVDPNYTITYGSGSVVVNQAPLTITASSGAMTYGATPPAITPVYGGFVNGDNASSLQTKPTCSTTATSASSGRGLAVRLVVHGCGGPQLHHHLRGGRRRGGPGAPDRHRLERVHDLRRARRRRSSPGTAASSTVTARRR